MSGGGSSREPDPPLLPELPPPDGSAEREAWHAALAAARRGASLAAIEARARALGRTPPPDVFARLGALRAEREARPVLRALDRARAAPRLAPAVESARETLEEPAPFDVALGVTRLRAAAALAAAEGHTGADAHLAATSPVDPGLALDVAGVLAAPPSLAGARREHLLARAAAARGEERGALSRALRALAASPPGAQALRLEPLLADALHRAIGLRPPRRGPRPPVPPVVYLAILFALLGLLAATLRRPAGPPQPPAQERPR